MNKKVSIKEASKIDWYSDAVNQHDYPGDNKTKLGCLMRIADATEAMAKNHIQLMEENTSLKKSRDYWKEEYYMLKKQNTALKGHNTRLKKHIKNG